MAIGAEERLRTCPTSSAEQAGELRQYMLDLEEVGELDTHAATRLCLAIARETRSLGAPWFMKLSLENFEFIVDELMDKSARPQTAMKLWGRLPMFLHPETNQIVATRAELANEMGVSETQLADVLSELIEMNVVLPIKDPQDHRRVILFLNPWLATHATGATLTLLRQGAPLLKPLRRQRGKTSSHLQLVEPAD